MVTINTTFDNYSEIPIFQKVFGEFGDEYEYTETGIFRKKTPPQCSICGHKMVHNGSNSYTKKGMGMIEIGKYTCKTCNKNIEEDRSVWEQLKTLFIDLLGELYQTLRSNHVAYNAISRLMRLIFPQSKSTIFREFNSSMENAEIPPLDNVFIVHYDEQFPKEGRTQKYRLTILDAKSKRPVANELFDKKDPETIKQFLLANLDMLRTSYASSLDVIEAHQNLYSS